MPWLPSITSIGISRRAGLTAMWLNLLMTASLETVSLPPSTTGTVHVLSLGAEPAARSYDSHDWELLQGGVGKLELSCSFGACVAKIPDIYVHAIKSYDGMFASDARVASRFLLQASFGPSRASLRQLNDSTDAGIAAWIHEQMSLPPSLHRAYYRERANARQSTVMPTGGVRSPCAAGARWHRFAFTKHDEGRNVSVASTVGIYGGFALRVDGLLRTEVSSVNLTVGGSYVLCSVEERVGGAVTLSDVLTDCSGATTTVPNPPIEFGAADLTVTHVMADDEAGRLAPLPHVRNASVLSASLACDPALLSSSASSSSELFLRDERGAYHRCDPRLQLLANDLGSPANATAAVAVAGVLLPTAPKTFVNAASCRVPQAVGAVAPTYGSASLTLNASTLRAFHTSAARLVYYADGLRLDPNDATYYRSPCDGFSRWRRTARVGGCGADGETAALEASTRATIVASLTAASAAGESSGGGDGSGGSGGDGGGGREVVDLELRGACDGGVATIGARVSVDGGVSCWEHTHPHALNVYDFSLWPASHPGGAAAITQFAAAGGVALDYPASHSMDRWRTNLASLTYLGVLGDTIDFAYLPSSLQLAEVAAALGAERAAASDGYEACGSPGEVANVPSERNLYNMITSGDTVVGDGYPVDTHAQSGRLGSATAGPTTGAPQTASEGFRLPEIDTLAASHRAGRRAESRGGGARRRRGRRLQGGHLDAVHRVPRRLQRRAHGRRRARPAQAGQEHRLDDGVAPRRRPAAPARGVVALPALRRVRQAAQRAGQGGRTPL